MRPQGVTTTRLPVMNLVSRSNFDYSVKFQYYTFLGKRPVAIERRPQLGCRNAVSGYESRFPLQFRLFSHSFNIVHFWVSDQSRSSVDRNSVGATRLAVMNLVSRSNFDYSVKFQYYTFLGKRPVAIERLPQLGCRNAVSGYESRFPLQI